MDKFNISNIKNNNNLLEQYYMQRESFSNIEEKSERFTIYNIKKEYIRTGNVAI